jgi:hypothetical protein
MRKRLFLLLFSATLLGCATIGNSIAEDQFVNVPGGLKKADISRCMNNAKMKCYDLGYKIVNEDKDAGYLVAEKNVNNSIWTLIVQINENGYIVKHNANDVTSYMNPYFGKWKGDLKSTIQKSVEK